MVKVQRKPSGSTNAFNNVARPNTTSGTGHHNSFSRPLKLKVRTNIFSDTGPDPNNTQVVHKPVVRKESATWMIKKNNQMKYTTENVEKYEDPRKKSMQVCVKNEGYETARNKMRSQAADKFFKLAKSRYGGAEDLFRAFQKGKGDSIDLEEFSEMFRKRSLDLYFPRDEQRLLFEQFDGNNSSSIGVEKVIRHYEDAAPTIVATTRVTEQQKKERSEKIVEKLYKERDSQKLLMSPRQTTLQIMRSLRNLDPDSTGFISKEDLRWGLGKDYMNIPLNAEEIEAVVELCPPDKRNGKINYNKFVTMLDIKNNDPVIEPFFDARANQVTRMKNRIDSFDKLVNEDDLLARRDYLMKVCHGDNAALVAAHQLDNRGGSGSATGDFSSLNKTASCPELVLAQSPVRHPPRGGEELDRDSHFLTSMKLRGKGGTQHQNSVDLTDTVHEDSAGGGLMPGGRRLFNMQKFDESLLQHNMGERPPHSLSQSQSFESGGGFPSHDLSRSMSSFPPGEDDRFNTTSSSYFAPLLYRPSVPVTRPHVMGDSMRSALDREERRKKRYQRTAKNLQSFADHKELEELSTTINDSLRCKGRALEALHYESAAIHSDIKKFSKQPLITMQRKSNKALYDKMWGGDKEQSRKPVDKPDDRDFNTTYNGSFVIQDQLTANGD